MTQHTGDKPVWEMRGEPMGLRILPDQGRGREMEVSERLQGKFLGEDITNFATYTVTMQPDGSLRAQGQGIAYLKDGSMTTVVGSGEGKAQGPGGSQEWHVTLEFRNPTGRFSEFRDRPITGGFEVDPSMKSHWKLFAPK
jgi:hypothetical protein